MIAFNNTTTLLNKSPQLHKILILSGSYFYKYSMILLPQMYLIF